MASLSWLSAAVSSLLSLCLFVPAALSQQANWRQLFPYIQDSATFPLIKDTFFDFIVVGGGTAGCPLAATLSSRFKVLVLERGGVPYDQPAVYRREGFPCVLGTRAAQPFRSVDGVHNRRGNVLGGGSSVNAGFYSRASADFIAEAGWDPAAVAQSYDWVERRIVFQPRAGPWQRAFRNAMLGAGIQPWNGHSFDHVYGTKMANSIFDNTGVRRTAADLLAAGNRTNLHVLIYATALKIVFSQGPGTRQALGVVFKDLNGTQHVARLAGGGEVLLTAGALGTPQLLMLSGVGPAQDLQRLGVPLVAELSSLGKDIADIPINAINVLSPTPVEESSLELVGILPSGNIIEGASGGNHTVCWPAGGEINTLPPHDRSDQLTSFAETVLGILPPQITQPLNQAGFILSKVYRPQSRGRLWLTSTNASENPQVLYNYYSQQADVDVCVNGSRILRRILATAAFRNFRFTSVPTPLLFLDPTLLSVPAGQFEGAIPVLPQAGNFSAEAQWCKDTVSVIWHFHGGCHYPECVDQEYRVQGVGGVRVIDGTTWPSSPGTNPMATCLMLGRYMGVRILKQRGVI